MTLDRINKIRKKMLEYSSKYIEILNYAIRKNKEPEEKRLLRLSNEYEIS